MFDLILDSVEDFHTVEERRLHRIFCGLEYHICPVWPNGEVKYCITPLDTQQDTVYKNADDMLEYIIDDTRLRDIITKVEVTDRTL